MNKAEKLEQEQLAKNAEYKRKQENSDKISREYSLHRREINSQSPEQKAQRLEMFNLFYWGMTKEHNIPEDIKGKVIKIQTEFFKENPKRIYCDPILFRPLFEGKEKVFNPVLTIIERNVAEDMKWVKFRK